MDADRGPWPDTASFIATAARLEQRCIAELVDFTSPHPRSRHTDIMEIKARLDSCIVVSPYVAPVEPGLMRPTMSHPYLSAPNIVVTDIEGEKLKHTTIDWQGTTVVPVFMQARIPPAVVYADNVIELPDDFSVPSFPEDMDQLPQEAQEGLCLHHTLACGRWFYLKHVSKHDIKFLVALSLPHYVVMGWLILHICRAWTWGPLDLRHDLITLQLCWPQISSAPCPVHFTTKELAKHEVECSDYKFYQGRVDLLRNFLGCDTDGWVKNGDFDEARELMERVKKKWDPEKEKGPFPFEEGPYSYFLC